MLFPEETPEIYLRSLNFQRKTVVPQHNVLEIWGTLRGPAAKGKPTLTLTFSEKASNIAQVWNYELLKYS